MNTIFVIIVGRLRSFYYSCYIHLRCVWAVREHSGWPSLAAVHCQFLLKSLQSLGWGILKSFHRSTIPLYIDTLDLFWDHRLYFSSSIHSRASRVLRVLLCAEILQVAFPHIQDRSLFATSSLEFFLTSIPRPPPELKHFWTEGSEASRVSFSAAPEIQRTIRIIELDQIRPAFGGIQQRTSTLNLWNSGIRKCPAGGRQRLRRIGCHPLRVACTNCWPRQCLWPISFRGNLKPVNMSAVRILACENELYEVRLVGCK